MIVVCLLKQYALLLGLAKVYRTRQTELELLLDFFLEKVNIRKDDLSHSPLSLFGTLWLKRSWELVTIEAESH